MFSDFLPRLAVFVKQGLGKNTRNPLAEIYVNVTSENQTCYMQLATWRTRLPVLAVTIASLNHRSSGGV
jgi:hypothetical protein